MFSLSFLCRLDGKYRSATAPLVWYFARTRTIAEFFDLEERQSTQGGSSGSTCLE